MKLLIFLLVAVSFQSLQAKSLSCLGTEPFWNAKINLDIQVTQISVARDNAEVKIPTKITPIPGAGLDVGFIAQGSKISLIVTKDESCSDGMSEVPYGYSVVMKSYSTEDYVGCCKDASN